MSPFYYVIEDRDYIVEFNGTKEQLEVHLTKEEVEADVRELTEVQADTWLKEVK